LNYFITQNLNCFEFLKITNIHTQKQPTKTNKHLSPGEINPTKTQIIQKQPKEEHSQQMTVFPYIRTFSLLSFLISIQTSKQAEDEMSKCQVEKKDTLSLMRKVVRLGRHVTEKNE
jgi:hypothetical protein